MAELGIDHVKELMSSVAEIMCNAVDLAKGGVGLGTIPKAFSLLGEVKDLISNVPGAVPELADLDAAESAEISALAYDAVKKVFDRVRG